MILPYSNLRWYTFRFTLEFLEPVFFNEFIGAVLRSALGYCLKNVCDDTIYRYLFETPPTRPLPEKRYSLSAPRPYILTVPLLERTWFATGETLNFHLTLVGRSILHFDKFFKAFQVMGNRGIGLKKSTFSLVTIENIGLIRQKKIIYEEDDSDFDQDFIAISLNDLDKNLHPMQILLSFLTPVRLESDEKNIGSENFDLVIYMRLLAERIRALGYFHNEMPWFDLDYSLIEQAHSIQCECKLCWQDWNFFVNNHPQKMGGIVGQVILQGDLTPYYNVLEVAQWLHNGRNISYGFGSVAVQY